MRVLFQSAVKRRSPVLLSILAVGLLCAGCGYQAVRYGETFGEANRIAVHGFRNDTFEAGVDGVVTDALSSEIMRRGALRLVAESGAADWILSGVVTEIETQSRSFSSVAFSLEYEVYLRLAVTIARQDGSALVLDSNVLRESERYLASADVEVTRTHREEAIRRLAALLATRIHDTFLESAAFPEAPRPATP